MKVLVTGAAGFIGYYTAKALLNLGHKVVGIDNLNDYYDVNLKLARLAELGVDEHTFETTNSSFKFLKIDIADRSAMEALFKGNQFDRVIHLAAQA